MLHDKLLAGKTLPQKLRVHCSETVHVVTIETRQPVSQSGITLLSV